MNSAIERILPPELLSHIIELTALSEIEPSRGRFHATRDSLVRVCRRWRSLTIQIRTLWVFIYMAANEIPRLEWLQILKNRAHPFPWILTAERNIFASPILHSDRTWIENVDIHKFIRSHSGEWGELRIADRYLQPVETMSALQCPRLHSLVINAKFGVLHVPPPHLHSPALTALRFLRVGAVSLPERPHSLREAYPSLKSLGFFECHLSDIQKLFKEGVPTTLDHIIIHSPVSSRHPITVHLTPDDAAASSDQQSPLPLRYIKTVDIQLHQEFTQTPAKAHEIFLHLSFPELTSLNLRRIDVIQLSNILPFLTSVPIERLGLFDITEMIPRNTVEDILDALPCLSCLTLVRLVSNTFLSALLQHPTSAQLNHLTLYGDKLLRKPLLFRFVESRAAQTDHILSLTVGRRCVSNPESMSWLRQRTALTVVDDEYDNSLSQVDVNARLEDAFLRL